jgi:hypothetical protein
MTSLLQKITNTSNLAKVSADEAENFGRKSTNPALVLNKRVKVPGSLNGIQIPTWATLRNAEWHRITVRDHNVATTPSREGYVSQVVGLAMRNVHIDIELELDGQIMTMDQFIQEFVKSLIARKENQTDAEFDAVVREKMYNCGVRLDGGMSMFLQHMGAKQEAYQHAVELFKAAGAQDDIQSVKNSPAFHIAYDFNKMEGLKVVSLEMVSADRSQSVMGKKYGHGFIDLPDAIFENFKRVWSHNTMIMGLEGELQKEGLSQERTKEIASAIKDERTMANTFFNSISGATRRRDASTGAELVKIDAQNIGCGRWSAVINDASVDFDVWSNSDKKPSESFTKNTISVDTSQKPF